MNGRSQDNWRIADCLRVEGWIVALVIIGAMSSGVSCHREPESQAPVAMERVSEEGAASRTVAVTDATFASEVLNSDKLILLDFWTDWCLPCLELDPILAKLSVEFDQRIKICKINADENPETVTEYVPDGIYPCLILMWNGKLIERRNGTDPKMEPEAFLRQWIEENLKPSPHPGPLPRR